MKIKKLLKIFFAGFLFVVIVTIFIVLLLIQNGFKNYNTTLFQEPQQRDLSWQQIFDNPQQISLKRIVTGTATGDRYIVLAPQDANIDKIDHRYEPTPIFVYLINHPQQGDFLIDAGLSQSFKQDSGNYSMLMNIILGMMDVNEKQVNNLSAIEYVSNECITLRGIFLTHMHSDHTSGISDFPEGLEIAFGRSELDFMTKALTGHHLDGKKLTIFDFDKQGKAIPPFERVIDVFGDQSFWAISTPGHSADHISYLVNSINGKLLITGDAIAYKNQLKYKIQPNPSVYDSKKALESLTKLSNFLELYPDIKVYVGHDM